MATQKLVLERRNKISTALAKSVTSPKEIADTLKLDPVTVRNDLRWMRKESRKWLKGWTLDGYVFATKNTVAQLEDIEKDLQVMRQKYSEHKDEETGELTPEKPELKVKILHELKDVINTRWVLQGEGPVRMAARAAKDLGK